MSIQTSDLALLQGKSTEAGNLFAGNNLSDLASIVAATQNLGLTNGSGELVFPGTTKILVDMSGQIYDSTGNILSDSAGNLNASGNLSVNVDSGFSGEVTTYNGINGGSNWFIQGNGQISFDNGDLSSDGAGNLTTFGIYGNGSPTALVLYSDTQAYGYLTIGTGMDCGGDAVFQGNIEIAPSGGGVFAVIDNLGFFHPIQLSTSAAASHYAQGAVYYDTTLHKLRVGGATAWETITSV